MGGRSSTFLRQPALASSIPVESVDGQEPLAPTLALAALGHAAIRRH